MRPCRRLLPEELKSKTGLLIRAAGSRLVSMRSLPDGAGKAPYEAEHDLLRCAISGGGKKNPPPLFFFFKRRRRRTITTRVYLSQTIVHVGWRGYLPFIFTAMLCDAQ